MNLPAAIPLSWSLTLSAVLFTIGVVGVLVRRNALVIFMSIELMLNAGNLAFVAFAREFHSLDGQVFVFFVMTVAAAAPPGWRAARCGSRSSPRSVPCCCSPRARSTIGS